MISYRKNKSWSTVSKRIKNHENIDKTISELSRRAQNMNPDNDIDIVDIKINYAIEPESEDYSTQHFIIITLCYVIF